MLSRALSLNSRALIGVLLASISLGACTLVSAPAFALNTHILASSFGSAGSGAGELSSPNGVAIDVSTHNVYVADTGNARVDEFSSSGSFIRAWGWGVADGMPAFEICSLTCGRGLSGSGAGQFTAPSFIAIDNSGGSSEGDVYVGDTGDGVVSKFTAEGALVESWGAHGQLNGSTADRGPFGAIAGIAVDGTGTLLVISESSLLFKFVQDGSFTEDFEVQRGTAARGLAVNGEGAFFKVNGSPNVEKETGAGAGGDVGQLTQHEFATGIAVDSATGDVYVAEEASVGHYESGGANLVNEAGGGSCTIEPYKGCPAIDSFGAPALSPTGGLAVDPTNTHVYVAATSIGAIDVFVPAVLPDVNTEGSTKVTSTSATIAGGVNPDGIETTYQFEYGPTTGYGSVTPGSPAMVGSDSTTHNLVAELTGLAKGTTYHYRIIASNANGTSYGADKTLATAGPPTLQSASVSEVGALAAESYAVVDPHGLDTHAFVEYGTTLAYGSSTTSVDVGSSVAPTRLKIAGLAPNIAYHFRVVASNAEGTLYGPDETFTTQHLIVGESFTQVGSTGATVNAEIYPGGAQGSYIVEYGTTGAYGSSTPPVSTGEGESPIPVVVKISGLQPGTVYHFRFVESRLGETESGTDVSFNTHELSPPGLPDGRGYEMVTPPEDEGAEAYVPILSLPEGEQNIIAYLPFAAAADGNAVTYVGSPTSSGNGSQGNGGGNQFLARRSAGGGWTQANIQPNGYAYPVYWGFSPNLDYGVLSSSEPLTADAPAKGTRDLYLRDSATGGYRPLFTGTPPNRTPAYEFGAPFSNGEVDEASWGKHYAGGSADFSHVLFEANDVLAGGAVDPGASENNLYESIDGQPHTVNVLPDGAAAPNATFGVSSRFFPPQELYFGNDVDFSHVISSDGSHVFWTDLNTESLYVREDGVRTTLIAEEAAYLTASADGTRVLYTKAGDLYEDDLRTGVTRDLASGAEVLGLAGTSEDLEYVYLVAQASLAPGSTAGQPNLYLLHGGHTQLIATLDGVDEESATDYSGGVANSWEPDIGRRTAQATPSGHSLVFASVRSLTGYDNLDPLTGQRAREVYVYDADSEKLSCVSCDPSGVAPTGAGILPISGFSTYQLHSISEDGSKVFFESAQPLVPQAQNGRLNVYEWERDGSGSCGYADGCIYLLSSGSSPYPSYLIDASASGNDVFLVTRSALAATDQNEYNDIYDAHVGATEAPVPSQCSGTGCQGVAASPPVFATPASVTYNGVGNFAAPSAPVVKQKARPKSKKKTSSCKSSKKGSYKKGFKDRRVRPQQVLCKARKAAKRTRRATKGRGGR